MNNPKFSKGLAGTDIKRSKLVKKSKLVPFIVLLLIAAVMIIPFLWAISGALARDGRAIYNLEFFMPPFHWENFSVVFTEFHFFKYLWNSLFLVVVCITGELMSNSFIGFGMARYDFKGSRILFLMALGTMFLPATVMSIPMYIIWNSLGFVNTYVPLIAGAFFGNGFNVFIMRQAFKSLPAQLYEAAFVDGANPLRIFWSIYLPLVKPMLATIAVFTFIGSWNNLFGPLIYITDQNKYTVALALKFLQGAYVGSGHLILAAALITISPTIIIYAFAQKYFVNNMTAASIKG